MGEWAGLVAVSAVINSFSDLGLTNAIMSEEDERIVQKIYRTTSTVVLLFSVLSGIVYLGYQSLFNKNLRIMETLSFTVLLVIYIWTSQQIQMCYTWINRQGRYNILMKNPVISNGSIAVFSITLGVLGFKQFGYYVGCIIGQLFTLVSMKKELPKKTFLFDFAEYKTVFEKNKNFIMYQMPTNIVSNIKNQLPTLLIKLLFGAETLGYYSVSMKILQMPVTLLASSIGKVFFKTTSQMKREKKPLGNYVLNNLRKATEIAILPMILLISIGDRVAVLFLGSEWEMAGKILSLVSCQAFFNFLMMSSQGISITLNKQKYALISCTAQSVSYILAFGMGRYLFNSIYIAVFLMATFFIMIQVVYFCALFKVMNISPKKYIKSALCPFLIILGLGLALRTVVEIFI